MVYPAHREIETQKVKFRHNVDNILKQDPTFKYPIFKDPKLSI